MIRQFVTIIILLLGFSNTGLTHHSLHAHYDLEDIQEITGTVVSVKWINPHTEIMFDVSNGQGEPDRWKAEAGSINTLNRTGLSRDTISDGATITLVGPVSRFGRNEILAAKIVSSGIEYLSFPAIANLLLQAPPESDKTMTTAAGYEVPITDASDIFGVWAPVRFPGTGVFPVDLPLTLGARVDVDGYDPAADDLANECTPAGMPGMLDQPYPVEFVDEGEKIRMRFEEWEGERIIYMNDTSVDKGPVTIFGHSTGRWEGETLVIVTNGMDYPYYDDAGTPLTEDMEVIERYKIGEDRYQLNWTATTVDPNVFTEPVTMEGWMIYAKDIEIQAFECDT